jgi:hypothetical protein
VRLLARERVQVHSRLYFIRARVCRGFVEFFTLAPPSAAPGLPPPPSFATDVALLPQPPTAIHVSHAPFTTCVTTKTSLED